MKVIVLAAGMGSRLMPLTAESPKCMVELAGKPLLHRQIATLRSGGADEIIVVGGYRSDRLDAEFDKLVLNPAFDTTNMVSTLFCALDDMAGTEDLIISYGDIVYESRVLQALLDCNAPVATIVDLEWRKLWGLRLENPLDDAETLVLRDKDYIVELGRKPRSYDDIQGQYIGLTKIRADYVREIIAKWQDMDRAAIYDGQSFANLYMTSFLQHLIDTGTDIRAAFIRNGWLEVDTIQDLERYESLHAQGKLSDFISLES
ncbi:MAG: phosphocholine cytidylyltransferase family protein [Pseudomonadota bacterium]